MNKPMIDLDLTAKVGDLVDKMIADEMLNPDAGREPPMKDLLIKALFESGAVIVEGHWPELAEYES